MALTPGPWTDGFFRAGAARVNRLSPSAGRGYRRPMMMIRVAAALSIAAPSACATAPSASPQDAFFSRLAANCGRAFEGRVVSPPVEADQNFAGKRIVMHVARCSPDEIRIPLSVGDDRSRTWIVRRVDADGRATLALSHDHRHADGSEDVLSRYGGAAADEGSAARQAFPADAFSRALFAREDIPQSAANVWAMEVHPGRTFAYELRRPGRFFRLEFDLSRPVRP